jgi:hypothetical protein
MSDGDWVGLGVIILILLAIGGMYLAGWLDDYIL